MFIFFLCFWSFSTSRRQPCEIATQSVLKFCVSCAMIYLGPTGSTSKRSSISQSICGALSHKLETKGKASSLAWCGNMTRSWYHARWTTTGLDLLEEENTWAIYALLSPCKRQANPSSLAAIPTLGNNRTFQYIARQDWCSLCTSTSSVFSLFYTSIRENSVLEQNSELSQWA